MFRLVCRQRRKAKYNSRCQRLLDCQDSYIGGNKETSSNLGVRTGILEVRTGLEGHSGSRVPPQNTAGPQVLADGVLCEYNVCGAFCCFTPNTGSHQEEEEEEKEQRHVGVWERVGVDVWMGMKKEKKEEKESWRRDLADESSDDGAPSQPHIRLEERRASARVVPDVSRKETPSITLVSGFEERGGGGGGGGGGAGVRISLKTFCPASSERLTGLRHADALVGHAVG
ncbi:hypothetical protein EYF80_037240 [Liparis tanakae]|uniref:Uncharacterized protein n=1 Tax=Liparis tanakae TaxID=230148 RepID=A0A4Z2GHZ8_9TELE|nr:hypothetical protein EYF80_037240 [Liparis tanakae]